MHRIYIVCPDNTQYEGLVCSDNQVLLHDPCTLYNTLDDAIAAYPGSYAQWLDSNSFGPWGGGFAANQG